MSLPKSFLSCTNCVLKKNKKPKLIVLVILVLNNNNYNLMLKFLFPFPLLLIHSGFLLIFSRKGIYIKYHFNSLLDKIEFWNWNHLDKLTSRVKSWEGQIVVGVYTYFPVKSLFLKRGNVSIIKVLPSLQPSNVRPSISSHLQHGSPRKVFICNEMISTVLGGY